MHRENEKKIFPWCTMSAIGGKGKKIQKREGDNFTKPSPRGVVGKVPLGGRGGKKHYKGTTILGTKKGPRGS